MDSPQVLYPALARKTVVCVGVGGARSYLENLARAGVRHFVLIDGDRAEARNLRTQGCFADEAGAYKVDLVARQLSRIDSSVSVTTVPFFLDDALDDRTFAALIGPSLLTNPHDILLVACTDSFPAQARTASLALNLGVPYIAAQLYREGLAAELFFSYPGVTEGGCARCALAARYDAYLYRGYQNDVTSCGAHIFCTERVNALKGMLSLMLLLYGEEDAGEFSRLLLEVRTRNFVVIRMSPSAGRLLSPDLFAAHDRLPTAFFDEALWLPQKPNHPAHGLSRCPLCGGLTDLTRLTGTIPDTRKLV